MKTVFFLRPEVPGFWPSISCVFEGGDFQRTQARRRRQVDRRIFTFQEVRSWARRFRFLSSRSHDKNVLRR